MTNPVTVTQADRDCLQSILETQSNRPLASWEQRFNAAAKIIARHRIAAEAAGVERGREQGQREGKSAACQWLRDLGATKPRATLWQAAETLADQFEASEQPTQAIRETPNAE